MKVTRSSHVAPGSLGRTPSVGGSRAKAFAAKLGRAERAGGTARAAPARHASPVAHIGAELRAGKITAQTAIDKVVERVLDRQLGKNASVALRAKLSAALHESLADDPLLAAKVRALSQG